MESRTPGQVTSSRTVILPEKVWGRLVTRAEDRGVPVEEFIVAAVNQLITAQSVEERIVDLVRVGFPDRAIAERTGELLHRVAAVRRRAHLAPNKVGVRAA